MGFEIIKKSDNLSATLAVRVHPDLINKLNIKAKEEKIDRAELVRQMLEYCLSGN